MVSGFVTEFALSVRLLVCWYFLRFAVVFVFGLLRYSFAAVCFDLDVW